MGHIYYVSTVLAMSAVQNGDGAGTVWTVINFLIGHKLRFESCFPVKIDGVGFLFADKFPVHDINHFENYFGSDGKKTTGVQFSGVLESKYFDICQGCHIYWLKICKTADIIGAVSKKEPLQTGIDCAFKFFGREIRIYLFHKMSEYINLICF